MKTDNIYWNEQPPIKSTPKSTHDLIGFKKGKLTVIGLLDKDKISITRTQKQGWWVVKCDCGIYEIRRRRSLLNLREKDPNGRQSMCQFCDAKQRRANENNSTKINRNISCA